jgi:hypothetical protein
MIPALHGLEQAVGGRHHAGELRLAGAGIPPVDLGLETGEVAPQGSQQLLDRLASPAASTTLQIAERTSS